MSNNTKRSNKNSNCNRNARRKTNSRSNYGERKDEITTNAETHNDPRFYYLSDELGKQMANVSFSNFAGVSIDVGNKVATKIPNTTFMRLLFNPSVGRAITYSDAANVAGLKLFSTISANNGRTTQYAPQDVTTLLLALSSLIEYVEVGRRAFGYAYTINVRNRAFPKKAIEVMGFNPDEFFTSLADKRMEFNYYINSINKIAFPANIALFAKAAEMYSDVFTDDQSDMAQVYVPLPYSVWTIDETSYDQGTILKTYDMFSAGNTMSWTDYINGLALLIDRILGSATYNYIYADVLRMAEKNNVPLFHIEGVPDNYSRLPVYDPVKLLQIHNAVVVGKPTGTKFTMPYTPNNDVYPSVNTNGILYAPVFDKLTTRMASDQIFDFGQYNNADQGTVLDSSRYMLSAVDYTAHEDKFMIGECVLPDHYMVYMVVYASDDSVETLTGDEYYHATIMPALCKLEKLDWAPRIYMYDDAKSKEYPAQVTGDIGFYTTLDSGYLNRVNNLSIQALLELR